ncbi:AraC family transcriptional regulator [Paenibacillus flagellatus]|nr:AraC family transcriptional regulator [Paenibacillus flagellatus]
MVLSPRFEDALRHDLYGKSRLPFFILEKQMMRDYPLHYHNLAELSLVVSGTGTEILNGKPHRFKRGTVSLLLPHHIHEIRLDRPPVHKYNCMFDIHHLFLNASDQELSRYVMKTGELLPSHYELDEEQTVYMIRWFESVKLEYESDRFAKESSLRAKLLEVLVFLTRTFIGRPEPAPSANPSPHQWAELLHYVHLNYHEQLSLTGLAERFHWNATYISRLFKRHVGQTFIHYLYALRVQRAASLLATTDMEVVDIAVEVGFDHVKALRRAFLKLTGKTPTQYREQLRLNE